MNEELPPPARLLIVDDERSQMVALCDTLGDRGFSATGFAAPTDALAELGRAKFDLLLTDLMMPGMDGIELLRRALAIDPDMVVVLMTGQGTIDTAVEAMKAGAIDYILKPFKLSFVLPVISRALRIRELRLKNAVLERHLRQRTAELEAANKDLESFSYSVSHDLRAPLRAVNAFSSMIESKFTDQLPAEARELLRKIAQSGDRMNGLIDDLLRLARLGRTHLSRRPVDLAALSKEVGHELVQSMPGRSIDFVVEPLPSCSGDPALLRQVMVNLLSNAFKYTRNRQPACIRVGHERTDEGVVFHVRDNGVGFDMKYAGKLFGVFQRMHSSSQFEGTGIGLSIVHRIIQRHGGRIWAESTPNLGTTFRFTLPETPTVDSD